MFFWAGVPHGGEVSVRVGMEGAGREGVPLGSVMSYLAVVVPTLYLVHFSLLLLHSKSQGLYQRC